MNMSVSLILTLIGQSLYAAAAMLWQILWALVLGFALSGAIIAFVPRGKIARALGTPGPSALARALLFGAASSSCSYAAASMSRSLFRKGAHIVTALAFMLASTNLVVELSAVLWIFLGWRFVLAEFVGAILLVFIMALLMRAFAPLAEFEKYRDAAQKQDGDSLADPRTLEGWREAAREFAMELKMLWREIAIGILISGFLMTWVPDSFWQTLFLQGSGTALRHLENALVGPLVSVLSFICSVGNIPLAGVLYRGGISFGGALSFIYADLIIVPLILIYRRYYGRRLALWITGIFYASMVASSLLVEVLFHALGLTPQRNSGAFPMRMSPEMSSAHFFEFNYTFWLNLLFIALAGVLFWLARSGDGAANSHEHGHEQEDHCCNHH